MDCWDYCEQNFQNVYCRFRRSGCDNCCSSTAALDVLVVPHPRGNVPRTPTLPLPRPWPFALPPQRAPKLLLQPPPWPPPMALDGHPRSNPWNEQKPTDRQTPEHTNQQPSPHNPRGCRSCPVHRADRPWPCAPRSSSPRRSRQRPIAPPCPPLPWRSCRPFLRAFRWLLRRTSVLPWRCSFPMHPFRRRRRVRHRRKGVVPWRSCRRLRRQPIDVVPSLDPYPPMHHRLRWRQRRHWP
mmetsp:Transcript_2332/g.4963  ORF Transcript_2332/g.4963 Transcript_2332/m.4963 type:complete len:239 (-) Transcript_2332:558-1274(-)